MKTAALLLWALLSLAQAALPAPGAADSIALKEPAFRPRPGAPAPAPPGPRPSFKDAGFPLAAAQNYQDILAVIDPLSPAEA
jgi:hypothetical protein